MDINDASQCSADSLMWRQLLEPAIMLMCERGVGILELQLRVPEVKLFLDGNGSPGLAVTVPLRVAPREKWELRPMKLLDMEMV